MIEGRKKEGKRREEVGKREWQREIQRGRQAEVEAESKE